MTPNSFARLLVVILPACLVFTWISKFVASDALRREAIADLYEASERAAAAAPNVVSYYVSGGVQGGGVDGGGSLCSDAERTALMRAGSKLSQHFMSTSGWGEAADCCRWRGVGCASVGGGSQKITSLNLARQALRGTLPTELASLSSLTTIDLNENPSLSGTLPSQLFSAASKLTHFYAFGAALSGTLPPSIGASAYGGASVLQELELSECKVSGTLPTSLGAAPSLRYAFLEANRISGTLPSALANLRRLRELELSKNRLSGSVPLRVKQMHLEHFDVAQNSPLLRGAPSAAVKGGCSGGSDKYLRGQSPSSSAAGAARGGTASALASQAQSQTRA